MPLTIDNIRIAYRLKLIDNKLIDQITGAK